jgi:proton-translocating NADH-quinone oxidoreductase chain N
MAAVWVVAVPALASPLAYLAAHAWPAEQGRPQASAARWVALAALVATAAWLVPVAREVAAGAEPAFAFGGLTLRFDGLALLQATVTLALAVAVVVFADVGAEKCLGAEECFGAEKYYAVLLVLVGAIIGVGAAADLFNLWLWFETMAVASYVLVAFHRDRRTSLEAAVKYLTQGALGSTFVLVGIAVALARTGTLHLAAIAGARAGNGALAAAGAFLAVGFGVKAALVPLHTWLPDAHAQAPSGISAVLSGIVIEVGLIAMLRALAVASAPSLSWGALLLAGAALNLVIGNLLALRQTQLKRLLAFSSVSQMGYMLLGFGVAVYAGVPTGADGGALHLVAHALMKGLAFLGAGALMHAVWRPTDPDRGLEIGDLAGAARRYPVASAALSVAVLGLGGLPPLAGFASKWQIFVAAGSAGNGVVTGLVAFAALNSVLSLAYYAPIVNVLYRQAPSPAVAAGRAIPWTRLAPLVVLSLVVLAIGVWPRAVAWLVGPAGAAVMKAFGGGVP